MTTVEILSSGMVTGVGLTAPATCAAIRAGITGFEDTRFMFDGEWLLGCEVPLEEPWRGRSKLERMAAMAIGECLEAAPSLNLANVPLLLAVAEEDRPGRLHGLDDSLIRDIEARLGLRFHGWSQVFPAGRIGGIQALDYSRRVLAGGCTHAVVAGVDSMLVAATLEGFYKERLLLTAENSDGFIPGEGAAALLVGPEGAGGALRCPGMGFGTEPAPFGSGEPFRAEGMVQALRGAFGEAGWTMAHVDYRIADLSGPQFGFKEAALAMTRLLREHKENLDLWHPADCLGELGASAAPAMLSVATAAAVHSYAPGSRAVAHAASWGVDRAAVLLQAAEGPG